MTDAKLWVGLDVGEVGTAICVTNERGQVLLEAQCPTSASAIHEKLAIFEVSSIRAVGVEAGSGDFVSRALAELGYPVALFEARKASKFLAIRRNKTDAGDAHGLAQLARLGEQTVSTVRLKSPEARRLRALLTLRHRIVTLRLTLTNSLRSQFVQHGIRITYSRTPGRLRRVTEDALESVRSTSGVDLSNCIRPLVELCEQMSDYLRSMDKSLLEEANANAACRTMMAIPGVGPVCAISFFTAIDDPARFTRASDVGSYLGLSPRVSQSGTTYKGQRISKMGNRLTRQNLVSAASVMLWVTKGDSDLRHWGLKLTERIGRKKAAVALARKMAIVMLKLWRDGQQFDPHSAKRPNEMAPA